MLVLTLARRALSLSPHICAAVADELDALIHDEV